MVTATTISDLMKPSWMRPHPKMNLILAPTRNWAIHFAYEQGLHRRAFRYLSRPEDVQGWDMETTVLWNIYEEGAKLQDHDLLLLEYWRANGGTIRYPCPSLERPWEEALERFTNAVRASTVGHPSGWSQPSADS